MDQQGGNSPELEPQSHTTAIRDIRDPSTSDEEHDIMGLALNLEPDFFASPEEISAYYKLPKETKSSKHSEKYGCEQILDSSFEPNSLANGFLTSRQSLPLWIYAIQEVLFREAGNREDTKVAWKNKTNKAGSVQEIELKVSSKNAKTGGLSHSYTLSIYLASGLIFFKGNGYQSFINDILPKCCQAATMQSQSLATIDTATHKESNNNGSPKREEKDKFVATSHISPEQIINIQENLEQLNKINFVELAHLIQDESKQLQVRYAKQEERLQKLEKSLLDKVDKKFSASQEIKFQQESQSEINLKAKIKSLEANVD
eukprot:Seg308.10 transcript_id=Seg308.10/GoldUCD/mRNA.D3Y31 product="hypothetical protein" protein_id=Seg308.10/GoldUCD/D3Y31